MPTEDTDHVDVTEAWVLHLAMSGPVERTIRRLLANDASGQAARSAALAFLKSLHTGADARETVAELQRLLLARHNAQSTINALGELLQTLNPIVVAQFVEAVQAVGAKPDAKPPCLVQKMTEISEGLHVLEKDRRRRMEESAAGMAVRFSEDGPIPRQRARGHR
jgi:hypothetical protein